MPRRVFTAPIFCRIFAGCILSQALFACAGDKSDEGTATGTSGGFATGSDSSSGSSTSVGSVSSGGDLGSSSTGTAGTTGSTTSSATTATETWGTGSEASGTSDDSGETGEIGEFAQGIHIDAIEFNQGVRVHIAEEGNYVAPELREARLIKDRPGLLRVLWRLDEGFEPRRLGAVLNLNYADGSMETLTMRRLVEGDAGAEIDMRSGGFHWRLTDEQVRPGLRLSVSIHELDGAPGIVEPVPRFPNEGFVELGVPDTQMRMEITFVPVRMNGISPDVSEENLKHLLAGYYSMNPISELEYEIHEEIEAPGSIIDHAFAAVSSLRAAEEAAPQRYYMGLAPLEVVTWSGISELAGDHPGADRSSATPISSEVANFPEDNSIGYAVHETGHAQGLDHNPGCNAPGPDPDWPWGEANTKINTQGYDLLRDVLRLNDDFEDYMNYCVPDWVSAFTWERTADRIELLTSWTYDQPQGVRQHILRGVLHEDGTPPTWWAVYDDYIAPTAGSASVGVRFRGQRGVGRQSSVGRARRSCTATRTVIDAALPDHPSRLSDLEVEYGGQVYTVELDGLMRDYDRFR